MWDETCPEASHVYVRLKKVFGNSGDRSFRSRQRRVQAAASSLPFDAGRDPTEVSNIVDALTEQLGWSAPLAQSDLLGAWPRLVGEETASHAKPVGITEGVLTIACDSTAWATQLRLMRVHIVNRIVEEFGAAGIESITFIGPGVPSWKRGPRSISGRGPRDTYG